MALGGRLTRRGLLVGTAGAAVAGGGLLLAFSLVPRHYATPLRAGDGEHVFDAFIRMAADGAVSVAVPFCEMGQGIATLVAQIVAWELGADWRRVGVEPAPVSPVYADPVLAAHWAPLWMPLGAGMAENPDGMLARLKAEREPMMMTADGTALAAFEQPLRAAAAMAGADVRNATLRLDAAGDARTPHRLVARDAQGSEARLEARWLIDASGRAASFARAFGAERIAHDRLFAFHLRLQGGADTDRDGRTQVESVEDGWWYSVLLPSGERLIAFLCDADANVRRRLLDGDGLCRHLAHAPRLHALCRRHDWAPHGRAHGADASSVELDRAAGERWLAVGDAALAFDPLSSKGISSALYTGLRAADAILACDRGDATAIDAYARHLRDIHRVYREQLRAFHAMEMRWPDAAFWRRRHVVEAHSA